MRAIILAAGEGKRMKSETHKVLHTILGKSILSYSISVAKKVCESCVIVIGNKGEQVKQHVTEEVDFAWQREQKGTGHAVLCAEEWIDGDVLVIYGDVPLLTEQTLRALQTSHTENNNDLTVISVCAKDPTGYGRVVKKGNDLLEIVEHKDASDEIRGIHEINTGILLCKAEPLKQALRQLKNDNAQGEYYLTDVIKILHDSGFRTGVMLADSEEEFLGINDRVQLATATKAMISRINRQHMENGVTFIDPEHAYIGSDVTIGQETIIYPNVYLEGNTSIGKHCIISPNTRITNSILGDGVEIESSTCVESKIGNATKIGPYAYIRPGSVLGEHCKIGDFVEIKNSTIGDYSKANHLAYVGDADVGKHVNLGCAMVTVNYDGQNKHRTTIQDRAFIGCNTNLVAPVTVHEGAYIAAGSTITDEVPENALSIARARQVNKTDWKRK